MTIKGINYNWFASRENGEEFTNRTIGTTYGGNLVCLNIIEHPARGEGDKWYYDIVYSDGSTERIFNPNNVYFTGKKQTPENGI